jgi:hypothetical protein
MSSAGYTVDGLKRWICGESSGICIPNAVTTLGLAYGNKDRLTYKRAVPRPNKSLQLTRRPNGRFGISLSDRLYCVQSAFPSTAGNCASVLGHITPICFEPLIMMRIGNCS